MTTPTSTAGTAGLRSPGWSTPVRAVRPARDAVRGKRQRRRAASSSTRPTSTCRSRARRRRSRRLATCRTRTSCTSTRGTWSVFFDGTAAARGDLDVDAISIANGPCDAAAAAGARCSSRPSGNATRPASAERRTTPTSTAGTARRTRGSFDATAHGMPAAANVDGSDRVDATHFYLSFSGRHQRCRRRAGPGRGRRLLQRRHVVDVVQRHARAHGHRRRRSASSSRRCFSLPTRRGAGP